MTETDWMLAAAGDATLAEELRTGICRCGTGLGLESPGCRRHEMAREVVAVALRRVWDGSAALGGPQGEDLELLGRFMPRDLLFAYEVLVHRALVVPGAGVRGGQGYDESVITGAGKAVGGLGGTRSEQRELRLAAGPPDKRGSSGRPVVRNEETLEFRRKIDRRLRKISREVLSYLQGEFSLKRRTYRCSNRRCGKFAEEDWKFCPSCGFEVEERERRGPRS